MIRLAMLAMLAWLAGGALAAGADEPKRGLVIANWAYLPAHGEQWPLSRPSADAAAVSEALQAAGFKVSPIVRNADKTAIESALASFAAEVRAAGPRTTVVVYYAGHGGADVSAGRNYIVPIDASPASVAQIDRTGVSLDAIAGMIAATGARATLIVFDACRNPLLQAGQSAPASSAPLGGWVRERERIGTILSFAQVEDNVAMDDGAYALALAAAIKTRGLTIEQTLDKVQSEIAVRSFGRQVPSYQDGIAEKICLFDCTTPQSGLQSTDQALNLLRSAQAQRPRGDQGQAGALQALMAEGRTFEGFDFAAIALARADLNGLKASRADFSIADLTGVNLSGADVARAEFKATTLVQARLERVAGSKANFVFASGRGLIANEGRLNETSWLGADLRGATFRNADLTGAVFSFADLRDADFTGARLTDAVFGGADLRGARFSDATLANNDLTAAIVDEPQRTLFARAGCGRKVRGGQIYAQPRENGMVRTFGSDIFAQIYPPLSSRAAEGLAPCRNSGAYKEDGLRIMYFHDSDDLGVDHGVHFDTTYLNASNRAGDVESIVNALAATLSERKQLFEQLPHVRRVRQALEAEMATLARQTRPLAPPRMGVDSTISGSYDSERELLAALAADPDAVPADWPRWRDFAKRRFDVERSATAGAPWPKLFPVALTEGDLDVIGPAPFAAWTRARARHLAPEVTLTLYSRTLPADLSTVTWRTLNADIKVSRDGTERRRLGYGFTLVFARPPSPAFLRQWAPGGRIENHTELGLRVVRVARAENDRDDVRLYVEPLWLRPSPSHQQQRRQR